MVVNTAPWQCKRVSPIIVRNRIDVDREQPHMAGNAAPDPLVQVVAEFAAKGRKATASDSSGGDSSQRSGVAMVKYLYD